MNIYCIYWIYSISSQFSLPYSSPHSYFLFAKSEKRIEGWVLSVTEKATFSSLWSLRLWTSGDLSRIITRVQVSDSSQACGGLWRILDIFNIYSIHIQYIQYIFWIYWIYIYTGYIQYPANLACHIHHLSPISCLQSLRNTEED